MVVLPNVMYGINVKYAIKTSAAFTLKLEENNHRIHIGVLKMPNSQRNPEQKGSVEDKPDTRFQIILQSYNNEPVLSWHKQAYRSMEKCGT